MFQVYIRILDNEWNVYRRYAEFRALHNHLRAKFPQVDTFSFPPKKAIGNKVSATTKSQKQPMPTFLSHCFPDSYDEFSVICSANTSASWCSFIEAFGEAGLMAQKMLLRITA